MIKTLRPMGNSYGIIIDRPIMDLLGIEPDTQLEVTVHDGGLLLRPLAEPAKDHKARTRTAAKKVATIHRDCLEGARRLSPEFLDFDDVVELHAHQIAEHGGSEGLRDRGLLHSAIAQPMVQFDGQFLHHDVFEMAAALHFSLVSNHPFVDGNKRTGLMAMLVFLELNGYSVEHPRHILVDITLEVAAGSVSKAQVAEILRGLATPSL